MTGIKRKIIVNIAAIVIVFAAVLLAALVLAAEALAKRALRETAALLAKASAQVVESSKTAV